MKKKTLYILLPIFVLLASSAIPQNDAYSQTATGTPSLTATITAPPPYQPSIATSPVYGDLSCPTGGVTGYGTTTPSSAWNLLCSKCVVTPLTTSTARPTSTSTPYTFNTAFPPICVTAAGGGPELCYTSTAGISTPTNTPLVINTPTGTGGPTQIVYPAISCGTIGYGGCTQINSSMVRISFNLSHPYQNGAVYTDAKYYYTLPVAGTIYLGITYTTGSITLAHVGSNAHEVIDIGFRTANVYQYLSYVPTTMTFQNFNTAVEAPVAGSQNFSFYDYGGSDHAIQLADLAPWSNNFRTVDVTTNTVVTLSTNPNWAITPTALPTNTPAPTAIPSYCSSVSNEETGFSWSGVSYPGQPHCFDIGPYDGFDFGGMTAPAIGAYPWLAHICLQDVAFGTAEIFGVVISIDVILLLLGAVMLIRNLFVS